MEAQTVTWLVFLALIKHVSTRNAGSPVKYPPTEPILSMRSEVTEGQNITISCTVESSAEESTLTLIRTNTNQALKVTQNNLNSQPNNSVYHTFTVTSADAGWYVCRYRDRDSRKDSKKKLVVKYPPTEPKLSLRSEVTEGHTITVTCNAESFPKSTLTLMRIDTNNQSLKITENNLHSRPNNSLIHKINVTPADAGWYVCRAQNTEGSKDSKKKELVVKFSPKYTYIASAEKQEPDGRSSVMLICFSHSFPPVQLYSWYRKSQGEEEDEIVSEHQNHIVYSNQSGVYYCVAENAVGRRLSDPVHLFEPTGDYPKILRFLVVALLLLMIISVIVVNLRYWRKSVQQGTTNTKSPSGLSNEPENLQDYDDVGNATARAPTSPNLLDDHTSEGEVELNFPQVRFTATPRRQTTNRDSSSSEEDESSYVKVRV